MTEKSTKAANPVKPQETPKGEVVTINGKEYAVADLSETAKQQMINLRITDAEIERLNHQLAIARTARNAYGIALAEALPPEA